MICTYYDRYAEREYNLELKVCHYIDGNLAIHLYTDIGEPFASLTVNLGLNLPENCAFVDTNNFDDAIHFIESNEIGEFTGLTQMSGFCEYPLYKFNLEVLNND